MQSSMRPNKMLVGATGVVLAGVVLGVIWAERAPLLAWYYVNRLGGAADRDRERWQGHIVGLGDEALPTLFAELRGKDAQAVSRIGAALTALAAGWAADDPRREQVGRRLADEFATYPPAGQGQALGVVAGLIHPVSAATPPSAGLLQSATRMLTAAATAADPGLLPQAFTVAGAILDGPAVADARVACRELAAAGLRQTDVSLKLHALRLAQHPDLSMLDAVVPLLNDPSADVRRTALLAAGPIPEVLATDDLLRWLHDSDPSVRQLCEIALRGRGLNDGHIRLGRLMTDPRPAVRLQVLDQLAGASDLEPGVWLRRLTHDPAPAVRAAAIRAAVEMPDLDLTDRLQQLAQSDPSATVRQLAVHYLRSRGQVARVIRVDE